MENDFAIIHVVMHVIVFIVVRGFVRAARPNPNSRSDRPPKLE
jgi:hypothetical protein